MLKKIFQHWGRTLLFSAIAMPVGAGGLHFVEVFLRWLGLSPDVLSIFHFFYVEVIIVDGIIMLGSALIGACKLLEKQASKWWHGE
jgi:hypothetical protein